jgi:hypothetical protein
MMHGSVVGVCQCSEGSAASTFTQLIEATTSYKSAWGYNPETQNIIHVETSELT